MNSDLPTILSELLRRLDNEFMGFSRKDFNFLVGKELIYLTFNSIRRAHDY